MKTQFLTLLASIALLSSQAHAQDIAPGQAITVTSDWHSKNGGPYTAEVVSCNSNSGLCVFDDNFSPKRHPMTQTKNGLQVRYSGVEIVYLFRSGGKGTFHDMSGKQVGKFRWSQ